MVVRTFQTAGIIIVCFIFYVVWFLSGKPVITTDYVAELNRMVRPVADESLNAAPLYVEAAEMCEQWPLEKFKSFEQIETWCIERGLSPEICASAFIEAKCREFGVTTANECFLFLSVSSIKAYQSGGLKVVPASSLSE